jgi:hypothetical protein
VQPTYNYFTLLNIVFGFKKQQTILLVVGMNSAATGAAEFQILFDLLAIARLGIPSPNLDLFCEEDCCTPYQTAKIIGSAIGTEIIFLSVILMFRHWSVPNHCQLI